MNAIGNVWMTRPRVPGINTFTAPMHVDCSDAVGNPVCSGIGRFVSLPGRAFRAGLRARFCFGRVERLPFAPSVRREALKPGIRATFMALQLGGHRPSQRSAGLSRSECHLWKDPIYVLSSGHGSPGNDRQLRCPPYIVRRASLIVMFQTNAAGSCDPKSCHREP